MNIRELAPSDADAVAALEAVLFADESPWSREVLLTQFAQPPVIHSFRPVIVVQVQIVFGGESGEFQPCQVAFPFSALDFPGKTIRQELRIGQLLLLCFMKYHTHMFCQVR